jgi:hypothetical protein
MAMSTAHSPIVFAKVIVKLIIVAAICSGVAVWFASRPAAPASTEPVTVPQVSTFPVYPMTATRLFQEYETNEVAADVKMRGKLLLIRGFVQSIDKDFTDSIIVRLRTSNNFQTVNLAINPGRETLLAQLQKGDDVDISCTKMIRILTSPTGSDCVLRRVNKVVILHP